MTGKLRVVYLIDKLHRAGAQVHLGSLASGLDRNHFEPEVICLLEGGPVADELRARGVPVDALALGRLYGPRGLLGLPRLARRLQTGPVHVLHTYLPSANIYGTLAGRRARVGAIVTSRRDTGFSRNWRLRLLEQWLINPRVDRVVAVSPAVAECTRLERGLRPEQIVTIENGVDLAAWDPAAQPREETRETWGLKGDELAVGVIGHLSPVKGHADFLRAAALVAAKTPQARFFLAGEGPLRASLARLAGELGLAQRLTFMGAQSKIPAILAMLDVVVVPSHTEGMSNALLEAMAMARPVVATAAGGNRDVVQDGATGHLVPQGDPRSLAAALLALMSDRSQAEALGRAARAWVAEHLSLERMIHRYSCLYRELAHP